MKEIEEKINLEEAFKIIKDLEKSTINKTWFVTTFGKEEEKSSKQ